MINKVVEVLMPKDKVIPIGYINAVWESIVYTLIFFAVVVGINLVIPRVTVATPPNPNQPNHRYILIY